MGKYGNGVSMKTVITSELGDIKQAIGRSDVAEEDEKIIKSAFLEMAYQWASSNAAFCAFDALLKDLHPDIWNEMMNTFLHSPVYNGTFMKKMQDTWPY